MDLKEAGSSFLTAIRERAVSPLFGAFVGFWLLFNWQALVVFALSDLDIVSRIRYVTSTYGNDWRANLWEPALYALVTVIVYPFAALGPHWLVAKAGSLREVINARYSGIGLVPASHLANIELQRRDERRIFADVNAANHEEIRRLKEELTSSQRAQGGARELQATVSGLREEVQTLKDDAVEGAAKLRSEADAHGAALQAASGLRTERDCVRAELEEEKGTGAWIAAYNKEEAGVKERYASCLRDVQNHSMFPEQCPGESRQFAVERGLVRVEGPRAGKLSRKGEVLSAYIHASKREA